MPSLFYPGDAPQVSGNSITLDLMLKEPTRIARYISDLAAAGMFTNRLFSTGSAQGGAIMYDTILANDLFADDAMGVIAPGAEYPRVDVSMGAPEIVRTDKIGGLFDVTDEARARNDETVMQRGARKVANTMVRDVDARGMEAIGAALTKYDSDVIKIESGGWASINKTKASDQTAAKSIRADLNKALAEASKTQLGYKQDVLILNPDDHVQFSNSFGSDGDEAAFLASRGLEIIDTPLLAAGTAWLAASGQLGVMGVEQPIQTTTYREESRDVTVTKTSAMMAFAVTDPISLIQIRNIGA